MQAFMKSFLSSPVSAHFRSAVTNTSSRSFRTSVPRLKNDDDGTTDKPEDNAVKPRVPFNPKAEKQLALSLTEKELIAAKRKKNEVLKRKYQKPYESSYETIRPLAPMARVVDQFKPQKKRISKFKQEDFDAFYDVCIIGGGVMGCAAAYFLAQRIYDGMKICVIEKDTTYSKCSTTLSVGGLRQQFSLPENIEMSMFGADFLRNANKLLYVHGMDPPNVRFQPHGYLFLASEEGAEIMKENHEVQTALGAKVELLTAKRLKDRFPWINTDGVALGSYGYENEGWFDPWGLMTALKLKAMELGVDFIDGEVVNIAHQTNNHRVWKEDEEDLDEQLRLHNRPREAHVELPDGDIYPINSSLFVIAAGAESGHIAHLFGIGAANTGVLQVPLPVEPRKRYVYCVHAPDGPGLNCPLTIDPTGTYFRREGHSGMYLCGRSPPPGCPEPSTDNMDVDYDFFDEFVWPNIAGRAKGFENLKVKSAWAGMYDYNRWDQNAFIGNHPHHGNVIFATGFSGHGIQQAPAIGRAVMELVYESKYQTIDLTRFGFDRVLNDIQVLERNIV